MNQPLSYVHPDAIIAKNVVIEPFTTIDKNVKIGQGSWIGPNVTIMEGTRIGKNCNIFPGAIIGGLLIGATEKVLEVYIGPYFGGAIEGWAPYVLAIFFLLYRPEGLFGEKIIRRV